MNPLELRFEFGKNWLNFSKEIDEVSVKEAENDFIFMLEIENLAGLTLLDIGSGSGLSSLVARRLGAIVFSFDYDIQSVACTQRIKNKYYPNDSRWIIEEGSVLDEAYIKKVGSFDIVYSWGVLHHTGDMWRALENAGNAVKRNGKFFIALYNDQGFVSRYWLFIKRLYSKYPAIQFSLVILHSFHLFFLPTLANLVLQKKQVRGMNRWYDLVDWVGGYPFEVAKPKEVINFCKSMGFTLEKISTTTRHGCNQYVFSKDC